MPKISPMPAIETTTAPPRSAIMRAIKSSGTKPEEALRAALASFGIVPDSLNDRDLPGSPDLAFYGRRLAVFVDGAFWHGKGGIPKTNRAWWAEKLRRNRARDRRASEALGKLGWRPYRIDAGFAARRPAVAALLVVLELQKRPEAK